MRGGKERHYRHKNEDEGKGESNHRRGNHPAGRFSDFVVVHVRLHAHPRPAR